MPYYEFGNDDIFYNQIKSYPETKFIVYSGTTFYNDRAAITGTYTDDVGLVGRGYVSLYEMNVDRPSDALIYPFITKQGSLTSFRTITAKSFNSDFSYGDIISGSYPLSASFDRISYAAAASRSRFDSVKTALKSYEAISPHYQVSSSLLGRDLNSVAMNFICIPSIFYGSTIKKGSIDLKFNITGSTIGQIKDLRRNGELIQTGPVGSPMSGATVGIVLYNEGIIILTGSTDISNGAHTEVYVPGSSATDPEWLYFFTTGSDSDRIVSSSYEMNFSGTMYTPVATMMAYAPKGDLNWSNNPTYRVYNDGTGSLTSSYGFKERPSKLTNIVSSSFSNYQSDFENTTYISQIGIYDEHKNLIAVTKLANPVKKTEKLDYMFKIKLDI